MIANLSIAKKVWYAFGAILAVTILNAGLIFIDTVHLKASIDRSSRGSMAAKALEDYRNTVERAHLHMLEIVQRGDYRFEDNFNTAIKGAEVTYAAAREAFADTPIASDIDAIHARFLEWYDNVAIRQLEDVRDPYKVDTARVREFSVRNGSIWADINGRFEAAVNWERGAVRDRISAQETSLFALQITSVAATCLLLVMCISMALVMRRGVAVPLKTLAAATGRLKDRDWTVTIEGTGRGDEIGSMASALEVFRDQGVRNEAIEAEQQRESEEKIRQADRLQDAVRGFRDTTTGLLKQLSGAGVSLGEAATSLDQVVGASFDYTQSVSSAATATGTSVQSVAAAIEEMTMSIRDVSAQLQNVSRLTQTTKEATEAAGGKVAGLQTRSEKIHDVIDLINGIAGQINLLALNATIEAARAGDAGKGFAVVAHEVKQLADQTAKATDDIGQVISHIAVDVGEVVAAIQTISTSIAEVNGNTAAVAVAVEQQSNALDEISRNVNNVSNQTSGVAGNVKGVESKVGETKEVATDVNRLSQSLKESSAQLSGTIEAFIGAVANDRGAPSRSA